MSRTGLAADYTWECEVVSQPENAALSVDAVFSVLMWEGDRITDCTLTIRNTTESRVTIIWAESLFILPDGSTERLTPIDERSIEQAGVPAPSLIAPQTEIQETAWPPDLDGKHIWIADGDRVQLLLTWTWQQDLERRSEVWEWRFVKSLVPEAPEEPREPTPIHWWLVGGALLGIASVWVVLQLTGVVTPLW